MTEDDAKKEAATEPETPPETDGEVPDAPILPVKTVAFREDDDLDDDASPDAVFEALWRRVLEAWDDDKPHGAALSYALEKQKLPDIAGRYRKLMEDPEKGPRAKKKIDGIVVAATQMLMATKAPVREKVPWQWTASVAAVCFLIIAFLAYKIVLRH